MGSREVYPRLDQSARLKWRLRHWHRAPPSTNKAAGSARIKKCWRRGRREPSLGPAHTPSARAVERWRRVNGHKTPTRGRGLPRVVRTVCTAVRAAARRSVVGEAQLVIADAEGVALADDAPLDALTRVFDA